MEFFMECLFDASRSRWWQVVAAACIGGMLGLAGAAEGGGGVRARCGRAAAGARFVSGPLSAVGRCGATMP